MLAASKVNSWSTEFSDQYEIALKAFPELHDVLVFLKRGREQTIEAESLKTFLKENDSHLKQLLVT